jgi:hypothetical protein
MIEDLKILANKRDVPYQSLLKVFLAERLEAERGDRGSGFSGCARFIRRQYGGGRIGRMWGSLSDECFVIILFICI